MLAKFEAVLSTSELVQLGRLRRSQPGLCVRAVDPAALVVGGRLVLMGTDAREADAYVVSLSFPREFPEAVPTVHECGGRIPRIADRHIFTDTGACCVELPVEFFLRGREQTIDGYINGPVRSYFLAQSHFEHFGEWPHGELAHGLAGVMQFTHARLGVSDPLLVGRLLLCAWQWREHKHSVCPCKSRRRLLKCHGDAVRALRAWPQEAQVALSKMLLTYMERRA